MATLPGREALDAGGLSAWCATSQPGSPVAELLGAWGMMRPSGVLVLEASPHDDPEASWAFVLIDGLLRGAQGPGPLGDLADWLPARCQQGDVPLAPAGANDAAPLEHPVLGPLAAQFVRERLLDQLLACAGSSARATLWLGGLAWHDHLVPARHAPSLEHALLEHARRTDEYPGLREGLGALDAVPMPARGPARTMAANLAEQGAIAGAPVELGWDFVASPDPAANEEWRDVHQVYARCDGKRSMAEILEASLLGHFRTVAALAVLLRCGNLVLARSTAHPPAAAAPDDDLPGSLERAA